MRKEQMILVAGVVMALLALPIAGFAALGLHDYSAETGSRGETGGACAQCHNESGSATTRGWAVTPDNSTTGWFQQGITALCYTCHQSGGGASDQSNLAMNSANHYFYVASSPPLPNSNTTHDNGTVVGTNLPYVKQDKMACTSCHNVHSDTNRPFLNRAFGVTSTSGSCEACHGGRRASGMGSSNTGGTGSVSVHPVGIAATTAGAANAKIKSPIDNAFLNPLDKASGGYDTGNGWQLGGKLSAGTSGTMECQTCHSIHSKAGEDLLSLDNKPADATSATSGLCEGCHGSPKNSEGSVGNTTGDHPMEGLVGRVNFAPPLVGLPTAWTASDNTYTVTMASVFYDNTATGGTPSSAKSPRCSSCHDAHGGTTATALWRSPYVTTAGDNGTNVADAAHWCWSCHSNTGIVPSQHHSNTSTYGASKIGCGRCHGSGTSDTWSAHNGFANFVVAGDATDGTVDNTKNLNSTNTTFQNLCQHCHNPQNPTSLYTGGGRADMSNPVWPGVIGTHPSGFDPAAAGTQGSHLVSLYATGQGSVVQIVDADRTGNSFFRGHESTLDNTTTWGTVPNTTGPLNKPVGANIRSKYGAVANPYTVTKGTSSLLCESCHNLIANDPRKTDRTQGWDNTTDMGSGYRGNLLLKYYADDDSSDGTQAGYAKAVGDGFCRGCHSATTMASGLLDAPTSTTDSYVHYPAAHTVPGALFTYGIAPYGRSANFVINSNTSSCPDNTTADATGALDGTPAPFTYLTTLGTAGPAANVVNCDSCHRVHNANTYSTFTDNGARRSYILEPGSYLTTTADAKKAKTLACAVCHDVSIMCN